MEILFRRRRAGPDAGDYELQLEVTHADFLGTVTLTVTASIARAELAEGELWFGGVDSRECDNGCGELCRFGLCGCVVGKRNGRGYSVAG